MITSIKNILEERPLNQEGDIYINIINKDDINSFIGKVIIPQIYDEHLKEFLSIVEGYHYFSYYNYFAGMRITHNKAKIIDNKSGEREKEIPTKRKGNFKGKPNVRMKDIDKSNFGKDSLEYTEDGGYNGKGGFVHFFDSNLTIEEASRKYGTLENDGLYSENLLSIVVELMFYNENYQVGVTMAYEFLVNNAGSIEMYTNNNAFYLNRYTSYYHQSSAFIQYLLMTIDFLFLIGLLYFSFQLFIVFKRIISELFKFGEIKVFWYEVIDLSIILLSYVSLVFWGILMLNQTEIKMPVNEKLFQNYIDLSSTTSTFSIIISINTILI